MNRLFAALPLVISLLGCSAPDTAVLEVRMRLPRKDAEGKTRAFARVSVVGSDIAIDPLKQFTFPSQSFALAEIDADDCNVKLSVVSDDPRADRASLERGRGHGLSLVVWFCPSEAACDSRDAPKWLFDFDRALWAGERTFFEAAPADSRCSHWGVPVSTLPVLQTVPQTAGDTHDDFDFSSRVRECEVLGCLDEESQPAADLGFCTEAGGHPCE